MFLGESVVQPQESEVDLIRAFGSPGMNLTENGNASPAVTLELFWRKCGFSIWNISGRRPEEDGIDAKYVPGQNQCIAERMDRRPAR